MHAPIQTHIHVFSKSVHFLEHHKWGIILTTLAVVVLTIVSLSQSPLDLFHPVQDHSPNVVMPMTYIEDPQYYHENEQRSQYIYAHLQQFKTQTQAIRCM